MDADELNADEYEQAKKELIQTNKQLRDTNAALIIALNSRHTDKKILPLKMDDYYKADNELVTGDNEVLMGLFTKFDRDKYNARASNVRIPNIPPATQTHWTTGNVQYLKNGGTQVGRDGLRYR